MTGPRQESTVDTVWNRRQYQFLSASAIALVAGATVVYHALEDWSWVDSLYFSVVAVTTVGFGDLTPTTDSSKLVTVVYVLVGISLIATYLNMRLKVREARRRGADDQRQE